VNVARANRHHRRRLARPHASTRDAGFTLVEIVISIVLGSILAGVTVAIMITSLNIADTTNDISHDATDAGLVAAFLYRDAQAAGGTDPVTLAMADGLGVSTTDWAGCDQPGGELVVRFGWTDRLDLAADHPMTVTWALHDDGRLVRRACQDGASADVPLGEHVASAAASCLPGPGCDATTESVELTITGSAAVAPTTFTLSATLRTDDAVDLTVSGVTAPLVLVGDAVRCPELELGGAVVVALGDVLVDDACGDGAIAGRLLDLQPTGLTSVSRDVADPYADAVPAAPSCALGAVAPAGTTIHRDPVAVVDRLQLASGRHVFCAGLSVEPGGELVGADVLLQVVGGDVRVAAGGVVDLSAPTTGDHPNLLLTTTAGSVSIDGGAVPIILRGVVHAPSAHVEVSTGVGVAIGALVADSLSVDSLSVDAPGPLRLGLPIPTLLVEPIELAPAQAAAVYPTVEMIADGGTAPYSWRATGLPPGLTMTTGGLLSGTPTGPGTSIVRITAIDATGLVAVVELDLVVNRALELVSPASLQGGSVGAALTPVTFVADGGTPPYSFIATGLPAGIGLSADGRLTGTPTSTGSSSVTVTVTDAIYATSSRTYTFDVRAPLAVSGPATLPNAAVGAAYAAGPIQATGGVPPYTFTAVGLPPGAAMAADGRISGTLTIAGTFGIDVVVTDATGATATRAYEVVISAPSVGSKPLERLAGFQTMSEGATLLGTYDIEGAVAVGGDLTFRNYQRIARREPSNVIVHGGGERLGLLVGGRADLAASGSGSELTVDTGWFVVGSAPSQSLLAFGNELHLVNTGVTNDWATPRVLSEDSQTRLPTGAAVMPNAFPFADAFAQFRSSSSKLATLNALTCPAIAEPSVSVAWGNHTVTLTNGRVNVWNLTMADVNAMNHVASSTYPNANRPLVINVTDSGDLTLPVKWWDFLRQSESRGSILWNFPNATSLSITQSFPGSLLAPNTAVRMVDVTVVGDVVAKTLDFRPWEADLAHFQHDVPCLGGGALYVDTPGKLTTLQVGAAMTTATFRAGGGTPPYSWSATGVPGGLSLSASGELTGVPAVAGIFDITVQVRDAAGATAQRTYRLVVNPAPVLTGAALPPAQAGSVYPALSLPLVGGTGPYTWSATGLPAGLSMSSLGVITGTPTTPTADTPATVTVMVRDVTGATSTATYTLFVADRSVPAGCPLQPTGWRGEYYANTTLTGTPALCRDDPAVNFTWAGRSPGGSVPGTNFSVRWTRRQHFDAGTYEFVKGSDDGIRVFVDGQLVIDDWRLQSYTAANRRGQVQLAGGQHTVVVEYFQGPGTSRVDVTWNRIELTPCGEAGTDAWLGAYYANRTLSGDPTFCRKDPAIDFAWGSGGPGNGVPTDLFSVRWVRVVDFEAGTYRFSAGSDDGVRVYVDDRLVIDFWRDRAYGVSTADVTLTKGAHTIRYEWYENRGQARATLTWVRL
jgi:choice-of-anchor A domain-containing protein/prepilin-type N-terminal cleavage/methylation domain-containing protein